MRCCKTRSFESEQDPSTLDSFAENAPESAARACLPGTDWAGLARARVLDFEVHAFCEREIIHTLSPEAPATRTHIKDLQDSLTLSRQSKRRCCSSLLSLPRLQVFLRTANPAS